MSISRCFKTPIYKGNLIKTKTVRGDYPLLHAIFHCVSKKYEQEQLEDKISIVREIQEKMTREKWKMIYDTKINSRILKEVTERINHPLINSKSVVKHIIPKVHNDQSVKDFILSLKDEFQVYIKKLLNKVKLNTEEQEKYFKSITKTVNTLIDEIHDEQFKTFFESEKDSENIEMVQTFFKINIYFLDGETGLIKSKTQTDYKDSIVLLVHSGNVYEAVGKLYNKKVRRIFDTKSSLIKALDSYKSISSESIEIEEQQPKYRIVMKDSSNEELVSKDDHQREKHQREESVNIEDLNKSDNSKDEPDNGKMKQSNEECQKEQSLSEHKHEDLDEHEDGGSKYKIVIKDVSDDAEEEKMLSSEVNLSSN